MPKVFAPYKIIQEYLSPLIVHGSLLRKRFFLISRQDRNKETEKYGLENVDGVFVRMPLIIQARGEDSVNLVWMDERRPIWERFKGQNS